MKKYSQLVILLPCHSLEDFPLHHEGDEAQGLLANWTAMFHPRLIHSAGAMPTWARVDDPPEELADRLLLIPSVAASDIPAGFAARAKNEGAVVIRDKLDRDEIIREALDALEQDWGPGEAEVEAFLPDFLALGYCFLQVELLTRQMRYASNLDEVYFAGQLTAAAEAFVNGEKANVQELLQSCFDVLGEERDHFYPVDAFLMDLTLVADTTIGASLRDELSTGQMINLLMSGETLAKIAREEPQTLAALKTAVDEQRVTLVGGEYSEGPIALTTPETLLADMQHGLKVYETHLGVRPTIYGRRRYGLSPWLPQVLHKLGFQGAIHATFDGGQFPDGSQTKTMWEGQDESQINALARPPMDATKPETFLNFCMKMGESMDSDHVATLYFAHWPDQSDGWFNDLRRIAEWGPALGKFTTMEEYFQESDHGGLPSRFNADQYRAPYLKQAIVREEANPISSVRDGYLAEVANQANEALKSLTTLLTGKEKSASSPAEAAGGANSVAASLTHFGEALPRSGEKEAGYLIANPHSFIRRMCVAVPELDPLPSVEKPVYAVGESHGQKHIVVDVPPMGFAWVTGGDGGVGKNQKPLVDEEQMLLRNEFFEIRLDETTGALRSLHDYNNRGNRLSQQLAMRMPSRRTGDEGDTGYSVMVADSINITLSDAAVGELTSRGRLVDREGQELAGFVQRYRAVRGSRVLQIEIELDPKLEPRADAWNSYYACRFAWADESANFCRTSGGVSEPTDIKRLEAPYYVEIDLPKQRTSILTGGLPYHRRIGLRMLDTLLIARGEQARSFRLGVGVDVTHPLQEALSLMTPPTAEYRNAAPPRGPSSSWLFHVDSKNVVATHWSPICEADDVVGFRVRLQEAYGRAAKVALSSFRNVASATKVDFTGETIAGCHVDGDKITFEMSPREWAELEVRF